MKKDKLDFSSLKEKRKSKEMQELKLPLKLIEDIKITFNNRTEGDRIFKSDIDKLYWIVNYLSKQKVFIQLNEEFFKRVLSQNYYYYLNFLVKGNIIEREISLSSRNVKKYLYKLSDNYINLEKSDIVKINNIYREKINLYYSIKKDKTIKSTKKNDSNDRSIESNTSISKSEDNAVERVIQDKEVQVTEGSSFNYTFENLYDFGNYIFNFEDIVFNKKITIEDCIFLNPEDLQSYKDMVKKESSEYSLAIYLKKTKDKAYKAFINELALTKDYDSPKDSFERKYKHLQLKRK